MGKLGKLKKKKAKKAAGNDCDVLTTEECPGSEEEDSVGVESSMPPNFNSQLKATMQKPDNFNAWTKLIAIAENTKNMVVCRKAYDEFLLHFPYSHTYWKKYANLEMQYKNEEHSEKVFERSVKANPLNVTLWIHYIQHLQIHMDLALTKSVDKLRSVFKEALKASGMEFHSDELWRMNIEFETKQKNLKAVTTLYDQLLSTPTLQYQENYERFKKFALGYSPIEILNKEELDWIRSRIEAENDDYYKVADEDVDDYVESLSESDLAKFRDHLLRIREQLFLLNEAEVKKRLELEDKIKGLYFYTAPKSIQQLEEWKKYLEFEVSQGQHERIVVLYERCLMTCTLYEDFWLSYAQYMEGISVEAARAVFERACRVHLPLKYSIHLQWAAFEEKHGYLDSARTILCHLENAIPGLVIVRMRRVGLERRSGNLQEAERLLKEAVQMSVGTKMSGFYAVKLSRFILKLQSDQQKATAVLKEALKWDPGNPKLHLCLLETEMTGDNAEYAPLVCVEQALKCKLSTDSKRILSRRRLEFLEDFGSSLTSWIDAYNEHQTYMKEKEDDGLPSTSPVLPKVTKSSRKRNKKNKVTTDSENSKTEDCSPPGVLPPPEKVKSLVSPSNVPTTKASATANVSWAATPTTTPIPSLIPSLVNTMGHKKILLATPAALPSHQYRVPPLLAHFPPSRPYVQPQNVQMQPQPLFPNRFPQPRENMYQDYHQAMAANTPPVPFNGPQSMDNTGTGMPFDLTAMLGYGAWLQNFGAWNRFFPPQ